MKHHFKSLLHSSSTAFTWHSNTDNDLWQRARTISFPLGTTMGVYQTYGDGITPHSSESVATRTHFQDWCFSFARYLYDELMLHHANPKHWTRSSSLQAAVIPDSWIDFLRTVKHSEKKDQWFSMKQCKVGSGKNLQYDKRYIPVPAYANGSPESVYKLAYASSVEEREWLTFMDHYSLITCIQTRLETSMTDSLEDLFKGEPSENWSHHRQAWRALQRVLEIQKNRNEVLYDLNRVTEDPAYYGGEKSGETSDQQSEVRTSGQRSEATSAQLSEAQTSS